MFYYAVTHAHCQRSGLASLDSTARMVCIPEPDKLLGHLFLNVLRQHPKIHTSSRDFFVLSSHLRHLCCQLAWSHKLICLPRRKKPACFLCLVPTSNNITTVDFKIHGLTRVLGEIKISSQTGHDLNITTSTWFSVLSTPFSSSISSKSWLYEICNQSRLDSDMKHLSIIAAFISVLAPTVIGK